MKKSLRAKAFALIMSFALLLSAMSVFVSYKVHDNTTEGQYKQVAVNVTETEALIINAEQISGYADQVRRIYDAWCEAHGGAPDMEAMSEEEQEAYLALYEEVEEMPGYAEMRTLLQNLRMVNGVTYMYINLWDIDHGTVIYLMDGSPDDDCTPVGYVEYIEPANLERIRGGNYDVEPYITNYPEYGWLCTATTPICTVDGTMVAHAYADIDMNEVKARGTQFLWNIALLMLVLTLLMMPFALYVFNRFMVRPVKLLSKAARCFVSRRDSTQQDVFTSVKIKRQDELGQLFVSMQKMEEEINDYIQSITTITAEKERVSAELNVATEIQANMLPSIFPAFPGRNEFDIFATMHPAKEVGGDFYDFFMIDDDHLAMVMADVSGKGVPAALFMVIAKILIKTRAQKGGTPAQILQDVNNVLCEGNKTMLFVTVWLGIVDLATGKGMAANAGHEDPVVRRAGGEFELIKYRHSPAVATMEGLRFREHEFELYPGDRLFVYTDGVPEATNAQDELYGTTRMIDALNTSRKQRLSDILQALREDINAFVGDAPQFDDITMMVFDYYGKGGKKQ